MEGHLLKLSFATRSTLGGTHKRLFINRFEVKQIVSLYNGLVRFIEGSPVHQSDLERVCAHRASAFFLLADQEAEVLSYAPFVCLLCKMCLGRNRGCLLSSAV